MPPALQRTGNAASIVILYLYDVIFSNLVLNLMMNEWKTNNVISYSWNFITNLMFHNASTTMWLPSVMDKKHITELLHHSLLLLNETTTNGQAVKRHISKKA